MIDDLLQCIPCTRVPSTVVLGAYSMRDMGLSMISESTRPILYSSGVRIISDKLKVRCACA